MINAGNAPTWSQQLRGEALRTQEMITYALCAITQTAAHDGPAVRARQALTSVQRIIDEIVAHITQPNDVSESAALELTEFIAELQHKTQAIQASSSV